MASSVRLASATSGQVPTMVTEMRAELTSAVDNMTDLERVLSGDTMSTITLRLRHLKLS